MGDENRSGIWMASIVSGLGKYTAELGTQGHCYPWVRHKWEVFFLHSEILVKKKVYAVLFEMFLICSLLFN